MAGCLALLALAGLRYSGSAPLTRLVNPPLRVPLFALQKVVQRSRKASLNAAIAALHLKNGVFSSHFHQIWKLEAGCSLTADPQGNYTMWQGGMKPGKVFNMPGNAVKLDPGSNKIEFRFDKAASGAGVYVRVIPLKKIAESK